MAKRKHDESPSEDAGSGEVPDAPSRAMIEARAHEIYLERGGGEGHDLEDWLQAEAELQGRRSPPRAN